VLSWLIVNILQSFSSYSCYCSQTFFLQVSDCSTVHILVVDMEAGMLCDMIMSGSRWPAGQHC